MSCSTAKASISGNSVVPGLPNITLTPSCLSRSRKARFPDITGKFLSPFAIASAAACLFGFQVFKLDSAPRSQAAARLFDPLQKSRIAFQAIIKPGVFRLEADQYAGRFAVPCDDNLLRLRCAKKTGQVVLDFGQRNFLHSGLANRASHDSASDLATIARISTVAAEIS